ncbi:MAG TPA: hypothetical protein VGJ07_04975 [Rugosimonospora sp.]|jgi:hypothetical protein
MSTVNGYRARWQGRDFEASPDGDLLRLYVSGPEPGFEAVRPDRYRRLVPAREAEWFGYVRTVATLRGEPVVVLVERDGQALVEYCGDLPYGPEWWPADRPEPSVCWAWVSLVELSDPRLERWPAA